MNISKTEVQTQNSQWDTNVDPQAGNSILVTGKPKVPSPFPNPLSVKKDKSIVDNLLDVAGTILLNLPPSPGGIKQDIDAARAAAKDIATVASDGQTLEFDIPIETTPGKTYGVAFITTVKTRTQNTGANQYASATFTLTWDLRPDPAGLGQAENLGLGVEKQIPVSLLLQGKTGTGNDHVHLTITVDVGTSGAFLVSPCISEVTLQQLTFNIDES